MRKVGIIWGLLCLLCCGAMAFQCSSVQPPSCIGKGNDSLVIRWGDIDAEGRAAGLQLNARAQLATFSVEADFSENGGRHLAYVDGTRYCALLNLVRQTFLKIQTLHAPGETSRFIEMKNPQRNVSMRALWNPKYQTYGSKEFRALFDTLETLHAAQ